MFIKNCPFCFNDVVVLFNKSISKWEISCPDCHKKGIEVKIIGDTEEEVVKKWNTRVFDSLILADFDYIVKSISQWKDITIRALNETIRADNPKPKDSRLKNIIFDLTRDDYGYLIFKNGDYKKCNDSHPEELLKYLKIDIDNDQLPDIKDSTYIRHSIIRLCMHSGCLLTVLPNNLNSKQVDSIYNIISTFKNGYTINSFVMYKENEKEYVVRSFDNLNKFLLALDKEIK